MKVSTTTTIYLDESEQMEHYEALDVRNQGKKRKHIIVAISFYPGQPERGRTVFGCRVYENGSGRTQSRPLYGISKANRERCEAHIAAATTLLEEVLNGNAQGS